MDILLTNNPECGGYFGKIYRVEYMDAPPLVVLTRARDMVHLGHGLLTHPLAGGLPPGSHPYRSVVLTAADGAPCAKSIGIIESAVEIYTKAPNVAFSAEHLKEYAALDLKLIKGGNL
ncbi:MAG: GrdX family protein [Clostridiales bacterium]|jgi:hypothetical protein|nr:GrdX family protein [Clostridiales bacterium]